METLIEIICITSEKNGHFSIFALLVIQIVSLNNNLNSVPAFFFPGHLAMGNYFMSIHSYVLSLINSLVNGHQMSHAGLYLLSLLRIQNLFIFLATEKRIRPVYTEYLV